MRSAKFLLILLLCGPAFPLVAGMKTNTATVVDHSLHRASGSLSSARASTNPNEYIYCGIGPEADDVSCAAGDGRGNLAFCSATNAALKKAAGAINSASYIAFHWNTEGECTSLLIRNGSNYLP